MKVRAAISVRLAEGCDAIGGFNRIHAILGTSDALRGDASVRHVRCARRPRRGGPHSATAGGTRSVALSDSHCLPGVRPDIETVLEPGDLITAVELPALSIAAHSSYRKVRDRASYAFALVSVAAALEIDGGMVKGRAARAWRSGAQAVARRQGGGALLKGGPGNATAFRAAADAELADAEPLNHNGFKIELAARDDHRRAFENWREQKHEQHSRGRQERRAGRCADGDDEGGRASHRTASFPVAGPIP